MNSDVPKKPRARSPYTVCEDSALFRFKAELIPGDKDPHGPRKGRPVRNAPPPPDQPPAAK